MQHGLRVKGVKHHSSTESNDNGDSNHSTNGTSSKNSRNYMDCVQRPSSLLLAHPLSGP